MKKVHFILASFATLFLYFSLIACRKVVIKNPNSNTNTKTSTMPNFFDFKVTTIDGKEFLLSELKGKKILVVNTASKCGLTPQYQQLQELYTKYSATNNFTIIGFPANNFGSQEPGTEGEIQTFCQKNYGVTFPMMSKIEVKGDNIAPIYKFLTQKESNGLGEDVPVAWNFQKFMINADGTVAGYASPQTLPSDEKIINWIQSK